MKRKLLTVAGMTALVFCCPYASYAAKMSFTLTDGKTIGLELQEQMSTVFWSNPNDPVSTMYYSVYSGAVVRNESGDIGPALDDAGNPKGEIFLTVKVNETRDIHFTGVSGIDSPEVRPDMEYSISDGILRINGEGEYDVTSHSVAGVPEGSACITASGEFDVRRFGTGIHVITVNGVSFKVLVK